MCYFHVTKNVKRHEHLADNDGINNYLLPNNVLPNDLKGMLMKDVEYFFFSISQNEYQMRTNEVLNKWS